MNCPDAGKSPVRNTGRGECGSAEDRLAEDAIGLPGVVGVGAGGSHEPAGELGLGELPVQAQGVVELAV